MQLKKLIEVLKEPQLEGPIERDVLSIQYDSRRVSPEAMFVALPGTKTDGHQFVTQAIARGASVVLTQQPVPPSKRATIVRVPDAREAMALLSAQFFGHAYRKMKVVGVTGTNGKTTVAFMIKHILEQANINTGLIGTVRYEIGERVIPAARTTPESVELHEMMSQMLRHSCGACVMEVSSHSLMQKRTYGIDYDVAVFTNLTQDHLDYHKTMDEYFAAKRILFEGLSLSGKIGTAVINMDDSRGRELLGLPLKAAKLSYGAHGDAMIRSLAIQNTGAGLRFEAITPKGCERFSIPLFGRYNVSNALAAIGACITMGMKLTTIAKGLRSMPPVPGRLERVDCGQNFQVFVDYAHTDDALRNVLTTLREAAEGRLLVCFGCGGNRDSRKRPLMGRVVAELADVAVLTSDNPRKEEPRAIIEQIEAGIAEARSAGTARAECEVVVDRREAIHRILSLAQPKDIVVIAGKGHETYQEFADTVISFDDRQVAREYLNACQKNSPLPTPPELVPGS